jgi:hypothetical protein
MMQDNRPRFPGLVHVLAPQYASPYIPQRRVSHTDLEKRKFLRETFDLIASYFESGLTTMAEEIKGVEHDFNRENASQFTAEIFVGGESHCRCNIWIANQLGEGIAYYEGKDWGRGNALNDMLDVSECDGDLVLAAKMGSAFGPASEGLDLDRLSPVQAAAYFWRRLVSHLD